MKVRFWVHINNLNNNRKVKLYALEAYELGKKVVVYKKAFTNGDFIKDTILLSHFQKVEIERIYWIWKTLEDFYRKYTPILLESCVEYVYMNGERINRGIYVGGIFEETFDSALIRFPAGITYKSVDDFDENELKAIHRRVISKILCMAEFDSGSEIKLDEYSSGILLHEVIGHLSERDVNTDTAFKPKNVVSKCGIKDLPVDNKGFDYICDDTGNKGCEVNLLKRLLDKASGNYFLSNKGKYIVRQRNVIIEADADIAQILDVPKNNCFIQFALINIGEKRLTVKSLVKRSGRFTNQIWHIPLKGILKIEPLSQETFEFSTICQKSNSTQVIHIRSCPVKIIFGEGLLW